MMTVPRLLARFGRAFRLAPPAAVAALGDEQVPGFAVAAIGIAAVARVQVKEASGDHVQRNNVPDVFVDYVSSDEVDFFTFCTASWYERRRTRVTCSRGDETARSQQIRRKMTILGS